MREITIYCDFVGLVDELGFMTFSNILDGLPSFPEYTVKENWFTEDPDTDPWLWKYRAPQEKRLAFGNLLGGHKGFIAPRIYSVFYAAFHPEEFMEERWISGQVSRTVWQLWQLFEEKTLLNTSDIRYEMGVTLKRGGSRMDVAIKELQRDYYITVAGSRLKLDKKGKPYGWHENIYEKVIDWVPTDWMKQNIGITREEARERILKTGLASYSNISRIKLAKILGI